MPYDPQRSHRRPQLSEDGPAPIDALLDHAATDPEPTAAEAVAPTVSAPPVADATPDAIYDEIEVAAASERGRPRLALLVGALLVVVLVFAWVRRRR